MIVKTEDASVGELAGKHNHKFYEPLVLIKVLNLATRDTAVHPDIDASIDVNNDEDVFKAFVNKLAYVCDRVKHGGPTISSFAIMNHDLEVGKVHYWFASNRRKEIELRKTRAYVKSLLDTVGKCPADPWRRSLVARELLSRVIQFNRPRITYYLRKAVAQAKACLEKSCDNLEGETSEYVHLILGTINSTDSEQTDDAFVQHTKSVIRMLERNKSTRAGRKLEERAIEGRHNDNVRVPSKFCWSELQHAITRLTAYQHSVNFMLRANEKWPQLFQDFEVSFLPSSTPMKTPKRNSSQTAANIVGRLTARKEIMAIYKKFAEELQRFDLDESLKQEYQKNRCEAIVHSEIILLDFLSRRYRLNPESFFNGWMYIGCSKPTCKLCDHYFKSYNEINSINIEYRPSHGNLYLSWRLPASAFAQQEYRSSARRKRSGVNAQTRMEKQMLARIRKDAFDIMENRTPSLFKSNDSNTFSARLSLAGAGASTISMDDMASMIGQMDLDEF